MCPSERYTQRRGRSVVPATRVRTRSCTRRRCASFEMLRTLAVATLLLLQIPAAAFCGFWIRGSKDPRLHWRRGLRAAGFCSCFTGLLLQAFARYAHALLLVWVGRAQLANVRGNLTDLTFVRAAYDQVRLLLDGDLDAFGNVK